MTQRTATTTGEPNTNSHPRRGTGARTGEPCAAEDLPELSRRVIEAYYHKDYAPLLGWVSSDVVFIGSGPDITFSKAELESACAMDAAMPSFRMENAAFSLVATNTEPPTFALVQGFYDLLPEGNQQMITVAHQRVSVCLRRTPSSWEAFHVHSSNEWSELVGDEVFPVQTSRQTYEYVMNVFKKIAQRSNAAPEKDAPRIKPNVRIPTHTGVHGLDPTELMWAKANGKSCVAHFTGGALEELPCSLTALEARLPSNGDFVRTHRSYIVNANAVSELREGEVELIDGTVLPVPAKRRALVRRLLLGREK